MAYLPRFVAILSEKTLFVVQKVFRFLWANHKLPIFVLVNESLIESFTFLVNDR